jgi:hypothetical protein
MLKKPLIYGETPEWEHQAILGIFRSSDNICTICISKVGATSIDLSEVNIIIQVSSHFGSRQPTTGSPTVVNPPHRPMEATKVFSMPSFICWSVQIHKKCFIPPNNNNKVVAGALKYGYAYSTPEDLRMLLRTVLNLEMDLEKEQCAEDAAICKQNPDGAGLADAGTKRMAGMTMSQMSGGSRMLYKEVSSSKTHPLFCKRQRR